MMEPSDGEDSYHYIILLTDFIFYAVLLIQAMVLEVPNFVSFSFLSIPTAVNGDVAQYATDMYQKEPSGTTQKLIFSKFDATELDTWFTPGTFVDAYLSLDPYVYQQASGIRLVAKKLIIHNE
jgi:hypothetical protein